MSWFPRATCVTFPSTWGTEFTAAAVFYCASWMVFEYRKTISVADVRSLDSIEHPLGAQSFMVALRIHDHVARIDERPARGRGEKHGGRIHQGPLPMTFALGQGRDDGRADRGSQVA